MTVPSEINRSGPYLGNGVTTVFTYGFRVVNENHLQVIRADASGVETTLVIDADYIVSDVGEAAGGQVAMVIAPTVSQTITILRNVPFVQETDLENQGAYYAETVEDALDLGVMRDQQLAEVLSRAVLIPASSGGSGGELAAQLALDITRLAQSADEIDVVSGGIADVETVADNISDVQTVAENIAAVVAASGSVLNLLDASYVGDGVSTFFTLPGAAASEQNVLVWVGGVRQVPGDDYTVSGIGLTLLDAPGDDVAVDTLLITAVSMQDVEGLKDEAEAAAAEAIAARDTIVAYGETTRGTFVITTDNDGRGPYALPVNPVNSGFMELSVNGVSYSPIASDPHYEVVVMVGPPSGVGVLFTDDQSVGWRVDYKISLPLAYDPTTDNALDYPSIADLNAAIAGGMTRAAGRVVTAGGLAFRSSPGAVFTGLPLGWVPVSPQPDHFAVNTTPGTTDMQSGLVDAVAYCFATGVPLSFPSEQYLSTATIPNLHNVRLVGGGSIKVGATLFPVDVRRTQSVPRNLAPDEADVTNTLFVATTGVDTNDGLGAGRELLTLGGAFNVMAAYGPTLSGLWKVSLGAGTFAANASAGHKFMSHSPIFIEGQTTGGTAWAEPTSIIDGVDYTPNGIGFSYYQSAYLKDIKTTRCANGVIAIRHCTVTFENVWSEDDVVARSVLTQSYHASTGGRIDAAQSIGVQELFNTVSSYNEDAAHYLVIDGQGITETGWQRKECCTGHIDYVEIMGCTQVEVELQSHSTANVGTMKLGGGAAPSPVGFLVANSEIHDYDQVTFNAVNPASTPIRLAGSAQVPDQYGWTGDASALEVGVPAPVLIDGFYTDTLLSAGAGSNQTISSVVLRQGYFRMAGYSSKIIVNGVITDNGAGGASAGNVILRPHYAGTAVTSITIPAGYLDKKFRFEFEMITTAPGVQEWWARADVDGAAPIIVTGTAANTDTGTTAIDVVMRRGSATDVITVYNARVFG